MERPVARPPPLILFIHNHTNVDHLVAYLKSAGLSVERTSNGDGMLAKVMSVRPDLIVLDFSVDGATSEQIKGDDRTKHIPLIGLADIATFNVTSLRPVSGE